VTGDPLSDRIFELNLRLDDDSAWALAQFVKRVQWDHFRSCAVDQEEAHVIPRAVDRLQEALAEKGYAPR
jgi:hypothetical protein